MKLFGRLNKLHIYCKHLSKSDLNNNESKYRKSSLEPWTISKLNSFSNETKSWLFQSFRWQMLKKTLNQLLCGSGLLHFDLRSSLWIREQSTLALMLKSRAEKYQSSEMKRALFLPLLSCLVWGFAHSYAVNRQWPTGSNCSLTAFEGTQSYKYRFFFPQIRLELAR